MNGVIKLNHPICIEHRQRILPVRKAHIKQQPQCSRPLIVFARVRPSQRCCEPLKRLPARSVGGRCPRSIDEQHPCAPLFLHHPRLRGLPHPPNAGGHETTSIHTGTQPSSPPRTR